MRISKSLPGLSSERALWKKGFRFVAGVDEVGRGAWAGPVVASAVAFAPEFRIENLECRIDDSKKLTHKQRVIAAKWIKKNALAWAIGEVGAATINRIGIGKATTIAMRRAINNIQNSQFNIQHLLIDAFYIPYVRGIRHNHQTPIIKGDQKSFSIAAASIIAKVYRDSLMCKLSGKYPEYGWDKNKAYGTREHQSALLEYGMTKLHRKQFVESWQSKIRV